MKLYSLIFKNEAARSVKGSLEKNVAARLVGNDTIVLFSTSRMDKILLNASKSSLYNYDFKEWQRQTIQRLTNSAIVATVSFDKISPNLYAVGISAGVSGFGPLAYQLVMQEIKPTNDWLKSDVSVSPSAHKVWNKMYQLTDLYERKWLGDFNVIHLANGLRTHGVRGYNPSVHGTTEGEVAAFLNKNSPNPQNEDVFIKYGNLYAYRLKNDIAEYKALYAKGEMFFNDLGKYKLSEQDIENIFDKSAIRFFSRLYK